MEKTNEKIWFFIAFVVWILIAWYCIAPHNYNYPIGTTEEDLRNGNIYK